MSESGDTIVILSSELISSIAEQYFNKTMFKQKVKIVDLKPHGESGYAFVVSFVSSEKTVKHDIYYNAPGAVPTLLQRDVELPMTTHRNNKGQFTQKVHSDASA